MYSNAKSTQADHDLLRAAATLRDSRSVCVLTGAGVSAESGLATFRGPEGLWKGNDPTRLATPNAFARDPALVWEFYNWRRAQRRAARPNPGHYALAELERFVPEFGLITQNVDRLHQEAGSRRVAELHGNLADVQCTGCAYSADRGFDELPAEPHCPQCGAWLRPGVVWFGELLPRESLLTAQKWAERCDVFMSVGTSSLVWPAARFAESVAQCGGRVIEVNLELTPLTPLADVALHGKSGEILLKLINTLHT